MSLTGRSADADAGADATEWTGRLLVPLKFGLLAVKGWRATVGTPAADGALVTGGPYRWSRHPMYTSVLMAAAASALWLLQAADLMLWVALLIVLLFKAGIEERALLRRFPSDQDYKARTKRFVPWLL